MHQGIEFRIRRDVSFGAVYATLGRLGTKGYVKSHRGDPTPERRGRSKRFFRVTAKGVTAVNRTQRALQRMTKASASSGATHDDSSRVRSAAAHCELARLSIRRWRRSGIASGNTLEEFSHVASKSGVAFARSWYRRQTRKTLAHLAGNVFRVAPWLTAAALIGGLLLNRLVSGLPERAIFAVLHRYQVFDHYFSAYLFFATDGIAIGHVIASMFAGCLVALAAKGREMVAARPSFGLNRKAPNDSVAKVSTAETRLPLFLKGG